MPTAWVSAAAFTVGVVVWSCNDKGSDSGSTGPDAADTSISMEVHTHPTSSVDMTEGAQTIDLQVFGGHTHKVNLTEAQVTSLGTPGNYDTATSTSANGLAHQVAFTSS